MLVDNRKSFAKLKSFDFETIYNLNFSSLNFRLAALFNPEKIQGYAWQEGQEVIGLWPSMAMRWSNSRKIAINLVDFWAGYCPDMIAPELVNPKAQAKGGGIGVVLAGRESRRSLPVDILSKIITTIGNSNKTDKVMLLGGESEWSVGQAVFKQLPVNIQKSCINLAGQTDWSQLIEIVDSLDMLITPDTGTMHLAAHLGTPVKAFFLSSAWCFETGPYGEGHTVYQAVTDCSPCLETKPCDYDVKCLKGFADPSFQRFLVTEKVDHAPDGVIGFNSTFDQLGQIYTPFAGNDVNIDQRTKFRKFIHQYLIGNRENISDIEHLFAEIIYREKDWMTNLQPIETFG
jgi:hypothetical protein